MYQPACRTVSRKMQMMRKAARAVAWTIKHIKAMWNSVEPMSPMPSTADAR